MEYNLTQAKHQKPRNSALEILRLFGMGIIIFHHFVVHGIFPAVNIEQHHSFGVFISLLVGWGGYLGNSLFILMTGYFSVRKEISAKRLVMLMMTMVFYSVTIAIIWKIQGRLPPGEMKRALFPFWYGYNWFVACYLLFMPLTQFLNKLLLQLDKVQYLALVAMEYFLYCVMPTFHGESFFQAPMLQFVMMYCIGGYLQLHKFKQEKFQKTRTWVLIAFALVVVTDIVLIWQWLKGDDIWRYVNLLSTWTAVSMFMAAVSFKPFTSVNINKLAGSVLGVYLIHDNPLVRPFLWRELLPNVKFMDEKFFVLFMIAKVLCVYIVCLGIDLTRRKWIEPIFKRWMNYHWNHWCLRCRKLQAWVGARLENL